MSTSTIENIAIGARAPTPTNRLSRRNKKTLKNISYDLMELTSPAQARAWQASLKDCFTNPQAFNMIFQDINQLQSDFLHDIQTHPDTFKHPISSLSPSSKYQEYINSFVALFAQSKFLYETRTHSELEVIESLFCHRCPKRDVFSRLAIDQTYAIKEDNPDSSERLSVDQCPHDDGIPVGQLARMCDVAVLKFLSSVNEKTDIKSIVWGLDYLTEMTKNRLDISLRNHSEVGWYGIGYRRRKDTIRVSVIDAPQLAVGGRTVIEGLRRSSHSASSINPDTGQVTPHIVPSIAITTEHDRPRTPPTMDGPAPSFNKSKIDEIRSSLIKETTNNSSPPTRRQSVIDRPNMVMGGANVDQPMRRSSFDSRPITNPSSFVPPPVRKTSVTGRPIIQPIVEEEDIQMEREPPKGPPRRGLAPPTPKTTSSSSLDFSQRSPSPRSFTPSPLLASVVTLECHTPSPSLTTPTSSSDSETDESDESVIRMKTPEPLPLKPHPKLTKDDIKRELQTLITQEGRISLLAILKAIIKLPTSQTLWTENNWDACDKCFSLIQFCMDFGLETSSTNKDSNTTGRQMRQKVLSGSSAMSDNVNEPSSVTYSRLVIEYAVKALIHCAVCTYVGCSSDGCVLRGVTVQRSSRNASKNLNKMIHQLERLHSNCQSQFREALLDYSRKATLKQLFHFLHVILQYCPRGGTRDPLDPSSSRREGLIVLTAAVFRIVIDRMVLMNLNEPTVKHNLLKETISFVHYATALFNQDFITKKGLHHLYQYVQRVALSVLLPLPSPPTHQPPLVVSPPPVEDFSDVGTFPRRKNKKSETEPPDEGLNRHRSRTITGNPAEGSKSPFTIRKSPRVTRKRSKQSSLIKENELPLAEEVTQKEHPLIASLKDEWKGLKIGALHQRIRRLSLLLELSEPGMIPDPSLLSSLFSIGSNVSNGGGDGVIAKGMVLMECCMLVRQLNVEQSTLWVDNQHTPTGWNIFYLLKRWGEAVGEGLKDCILRENELVQSKGATYDGPIELSEEPVFPSEGKYNGVNYGLKMMGCLLLLEITKFLREPPPKFLPSETLPQTHGHQNPSFERKYSNMSSLSTDSDMGNVATPAPPSHRVSSENLPRNSLDDTPKYLSVHSVDQPTHEPPPASSRKVSVYLRVNSRHGRQPHPHGSPVNRRPNSNYIEASSDLYKTTTPMQHSPVKQNRRMSMSAVAFLNKQSSIPQETVNHTSRHTHNPRRMSFAGSSRREVIRRDGNGAKNAPPHPPPMVQQASTQSASGNLKVGSSGGAPKHRPSVISRMGGFLQRSRQIAFRRPRAETNRKRPSTTTINSSATSSPNMMRRPIFGHSPSQENVSYKQRLDGIQKDLSWVDVVQHLLLSAHMATPKVKVKREQHCRELLMALKRIYTFNKDSGSKPEEVTVSRQLSDVTTPSSSLRRVSIATMFSDKTDTLPRETAINKPPSPEEDNKDKSICSKLNFSGFRLRALLEGGGVWGMFNNEDDPQEVQLDQVIEIDSASNIEDFISDYNERRLHFIEDIGELTHVPLSMLTYAGTILSQQDLIDLRGVAWDYMLHPHPMCCDAAGSLFLLSCVKENESYTDMKLFLKNSIKMSDFEQVRNAILRLKVLWQSRDAVWSKLEQSAPKLFSTDDKDSKRIGYSLPSQLIGTAGDPLGSPPWEPLSVCPHNCTSAQSSTECYRSTRHAPVAHLSTICQSSLCSHVRMSSVLHLNEENAFSTLVELDGDDYEQGIFNIREFIKTTLFPNGLLPLINLVIKTLHLRVTTETDTTYIHSTLAQISEYAEDLIWQCMLEQPENFFSPLLNQFNVLYQLVVDQKRFADLSLEETVEEILGEVVKPFHIILCHYPHLPPRAAHYLFNHFIGLLMRHTEQPLAVSDTIVYSVLCLLRMVVPSVKDLSMKELKNQLKKESCYTTLLTTARIRGVEKICITSEGGTSKNKRTFELDDDDISFVWLIAKALDIDPTSDDFSSSFHNYYLTDDKTGHPILSSLIIKDVYPAAPDGSIPVFSLHESLSSIPTGTWSHQLQQLLTHKMSEIARVLFATQMLSISESTHKYTEPNSTFIFEELIKLSSFPRKTLDSIFYVFGSAALQKWQLRVSDTMLRGVWSKFILMLFSQLECDCQSDDTIILFLTVLNGSLLLQSEDHTILRNTLAALLTAVVKFGSIFRMNGYQMVVPCLIQAYALHIKNKMVTDAVQFIWIRFYWLNQAVFLLQAISSIANLFKSDVSNIATSLGVNFSPLKFAECESLEEQKLLERAAMSLMSSLDCREDSHPLDSLDILGACPPIVNKTFSKCQWVQYNMDQLLTLCVTVASFNPEVLRGMQLLVFLDFIIPLIIKDRPDVSLGNYVRSLIIGCESLKSNRSHGYMKGERRQTFLTTMELPQKPENSRLSSFYRQMKFRERSGTSQDLAFISVTELTASEQYTKYVDGFKNRRISDVNLDIINISRDSLLSISAQYVRHLANTIITTTTTTASTTNPTTSTNTSTTLPTATSITSTNTTTTTTNAPPPPSTRRLETKSLTSLATIIDKTIRQSLRGNFDRLLASKGFRAAMLDLFPNVEWTQENKKALIIVIDRTIKVLKKLHDVQRDRINLTGNIWEGLENLLECFYRCIKKCNNLIYDNDAVFTKLKTLIDLCLIIKPNLQGPLTPVSSRVRSFIMEVPLSSTFIDTLIHLMSEVIDLCHQQGRRYRGTLLRAFFSNKLHFKESESPFVWKKLFLPLSVNLGQRDAITSTKNDDDAFFLVETLQELSNHIQVIIKYRSSSNRLQIERFFLYLKVILAAYENKFAMVLWMRIGLIMITLTSKFDYTDKLKNGDANEMYIIFCSMFLDFMESFLQSLRFPVYPIIWHVSSIISQQLSSITAPEHSELSVILSQCLARCNRLCLGFELNPVTLSRHHLLEQLLRDVRVHEPVSMTTTPLKNPASSFRTDSTHGKFDDVSISIRHSLKRKNSKTPSVPVILEEDIPMTNLGKVSSPKRPTSLHFKDTPISPTQSLERKKRGNLRFGNRDSSVAFNNVTSRGGAGRRGQPRPNTLTEEEEDDDRKVGDVGVASRRRQRQRSEFAKLKHQKSEDGDEEDSCIDTPRSSVVDPPIRLQPGKDLIVTAEIHPVSPLAYSGVSVDSGPVKFQAEVSPRLPRVETIGEVPTDQRTRPKLVREHSIHPTCQDEQTGQMKETTPSHSDISDVDSNCNLLDDPPHLSSVTFSPPPVTSSSSIPCSSELTTSSTANLIDTRSTATNYFDEAFNEALRLLAVSPDHTLSSSGGHHHSLEETDL